MKKQTMIEMINNSEFVMLKVEDPTREWTFWEQVAPATAKAIFLSMKKPIVKSFTAVQVGSTLFIQ